MIHSISFLVFFCCSTFLFSPERGHYVFIDFFLRRKIKFIEINKKREFRRLRFNKLICGKIFWKIGFICFWITNIGGGKKSFFCKDFFYEFDPEGDLMGGFLINGWIEKFDGKGFWIILYNGFRSEFSMPEKKWRLLQLWVGINCGNFNGQSRIMIF